MKKVLCVLCFLVLSTFAYAVNPIDGEIPAKDKKETAKNDEKKKEASSQTENCEEEEDFCTVSCFIELEGGVTLYATAGNFLSSCEGAATRCLEKLHRQFSALY